MMRRVVITGLGVITPIGNDKDTFWQSLCAGKNGVGLLSHFDTTDFSSHIAAEVKGFDPSCFLTRKDIDVNLQNNNGNTILMIVTQSGEYQMAEIILSRPDTDINLQDTKGNNAFMLAPHYMTKLLLSTNNISSYDKKRKFRL